MFSVTYPDIVFIAIFMGFIGRFYLKKDNSLVNNYKNTSSKIIYFFIVLVITSFLSFVVNFLNYKHFLIYIDSIGFILKLIQLPVLFYIFLYYPLNNKKKEFFISTCIILSLLELPIALYQNSTMDNTSSSELSAYVNGTFPMHHASLAMMMLFAFFFSIYRILTTKSKIYIIINLLFASIFSYLIIISRTRSILVGIFFACIVFILLSLFKFNKKYFLYVILIMFSILITYKATPLESVIMGTIKSRETQSLDLSSYSRLIIWHEAVNHFIDTDIVQKLFGVGIGAFGTIPFSNVLWGSKSANGAHNNYLHVLSETGIVGLVGFLILFFYILKTLYNRSSCVLSRCYFYLTIALLASGATQETFWFQYAFGSFWLFYIFFLAIILNNNVLPDPKQPTNQAS